ncbi:Ig-like domain-containing protein [Cohnella sp. WQ 127256]|uniref:Ig-like domain-containing protein n=1 Tax=Cohnella sp. WQ 127256 TaxID=2938790 RepID=UPI0021176A5D|nr:Ig-like domain-containing protein [Cohnella sp. WQ 127256]
MRNLMRNFIAVTLAFMMLISVPFTALGASSNLSTEQKYEVLKQKKIITGFTDGSSRLYDSMTREQLAVVLFRLLELSTQATSPSYDDVLKTRWSYNEIQMVSRAGLMNGTNTRLFSPADNVTVEQLAAVFVRSNSLSGGGTTPVTGKVSKWARGAVSLALEHNLIPRLSDYTVDATRGLLVEAAYAVYDEMNIEPLHVRSIEQISNQSVRVNLLQWINYSDPNLEASRFILKDVYGNNRNVYQATVSQDGMSIVLWTDRQAGGVVHTLTIDGITWSYVSASDDATKPTIVAQPVKLPNKTYEITFSEPVEVNSATHSSNYQFSNGLRMSTLQLSADQRKVVFTTSEQSDGRTYQLTIRNIKDLAGNVMDTRNDLYIQGNNDDTKPKVSEVRIDVTTALVTVKFSEKVDPQYANQTYHYVIDKGLVVTQATLDSDGKTVTLRTTPQQDAVYYTLTVSGIPDLAGNVMDSSTNWKFGAVANPVTQAILQSIVAINKNTIEITFNRALSDTDVKNVKLTALTDNGEKVTMSDWDSYVQRKPGTDRTVIVQYRNKSSNPNLFQTGHVYTATLAGVSGLETSNGSNQAVFAGTNADNVSPYVTQVIAISRNSVKVIFSEPVTNVSARAFRIWNNDGNRVDIDRDALNEKGKVVNEIILPLNDELRGNSGYQMQFNPDVITDAAGWNGLKTMEGSNPYIAYFNV